MKIFARQGMLVIALIALPGTLLACLWDYDTLSQERSRFPTTLELITGKFLRHSPEFYQWRIEDRLKKLQTDPKNLSLYDDLGVAYDKTGQHDKAIEMMEAKEKIQPGLYETYANWGTFLIHKGEFQKGLPYIDKAIAINPDAHFGREKYQKWLVEYVLSKSKDGKIRLPLQAVSQVNLHLAETGGPFQNFLAQKTGVDFLKDKEKLSQAIQGVLGMMRFSKHDSPILLEALGDLLVGPNSKFDAKRLATRAFLQASFVSTDNETKKSYRELARAALNTQINGKNDQNQLALEALESDFNWELADAKEWYTELKSREIGWIKQGADPEKEFDLLYSKEPVIDGLNDESDGEGTWTFGRLYRDNKVLIFLGGLLLLGVGWWNFRRLGKGKDGSLV